MIEKYLAIWVAMALGMNQSGGVAAENTELPQPAAAVTEQETVIDEDPDLQIIKEYMDGVIAEEHRFIHSTPNLLSEEEPLNELEQKIDAKRKASVPMNRALPTTYGEDELGETDIIAYEYENCIKAYEAKDNFFSLLKSGTEIKDATMENRYTWYIPATNGLNDKVYCVMGNLDDGSGLGSGGIIIPRKGNEFLLTKEKIQSLISEKGISDKATITYVRMFIGSSDTTLACITTEDNQKYIMGIEHNGIMYGFEQGKIYSLDEM